MLNWVKLDSKKQDSAVKLRKSVIVASVLVGEIKKQLTLSNGRFIDMLLNFVTLILFLDEWSNYVPTYVLNIY